MDENENNSVENGEPMHSDLLPIPDKAEEQRRKEVRAADAEKAMVEHDERETVKRANLERLNAEGLARGGL